jgi:hypothetical protein
MEVKEEAVAQLQLLLEAHPQRIFSARRSPRRRTSVAPPETPTKPNPRSAKRPKIGSEALPGEIPYQHASDAYTHVQKLAQQSHLLLRVKGDQATVSAMQDKSIAYARSAAVKRMIHEQEYEDRFYVPLQYRIRDQLTPGKYEDFVDRKNAAIALMDQKPVPVRSGRPLPKIPIISVSCKGLKDPTFKFIQHQQDERKLSDFLARSNGEQIQKPAKVKERDIDYAGMAYEHQTRFYYGAIREAELVGRKAFAHHNASKVDRALDAFGGPRPEDPA